MGRPMRSRRAISSPSRCSVWRHHLDSASGCSRATGAPAATELLRQIPDYIDIWDAGAVLAPDGALWRLWDLLAQGSWPKSVAGNGMGRTRLSKLLAAKRPRLVPIVDSVVSTLLPPTSNYWESFRHALSDTELRTTIGDASSPGGPPAISFLRRLDVALWRIGTDPELSS